MTEASKSLDLDVYIPCQLASLSHSISRSVAAVFEDWFEISMPEWKVMAVVASRPGVSAVEVARRARMDTVAVSRAVTKLIDSKRLERQFGDADRRRSILSLSAAGRELYEQIAPLAINLESELLEGLTEEEKALLQKLIDTLYSKSEDFAKAYVSSPRREISGYSTAVRKAPDRPGVHRRRQAPQPVSDRPSIEPR